MKKMDWKKYVKKTTAMLLLAGMLLSSARVGDEGITTLGWNGEYIVIEE